MSVLLEKMPRNLETNSLLSFWLITSNPVVDTLLVLKHFVCTEILLDAHRAIFGLDSLRLIGPQETSGTMAETLAFIICPHVPSPG